MNNSFINIDTNKALETVVEGVKAIGGNKEQAQQIVAELEKVAEVTKQKAATSLFDKGGIPAIFWLYVLIQFYNTILISVIKWIETGVIEKIEPDKSLEVIIVNVIIWIIAGKKSVEKALPNLIDMIQKKKT